MTRRVLPWIFLALATSCGDSSAPLRADSYEWRLFEPATGGGTDTLAFAWPNASQPLKIWAQDTLDLPAHTTSAIQTWEAQFLYGEFRGQLVTDSLDADVIVVAGQAPADGPVLPSMARECQGATDISVDAVTFVLHPPMHIYIELRFAEGTPGVDACLGVTTAHELGHALGIFQHSPDPDDLMYSDPIVTAPSARDRNTAERAYHTPTTIQLSR
jgi:predicted Zn-dependent protease